MIKNYSLLLASLILFTACSSAQKSTSPREPAQNSPNSLAQSSVYNAAAKHLVNSLAGKMREKIVTAQICSSNIGDEQKSAVNLVAAFQQDNSISPNEKNNVNLNRQIDCLGHDKLGLISTLNKVCDEVRAGAEWKITKNQKLELTRAIQDTNNCMSME